MIWMHMKCSRQKIYLIWSQRGHFWSIRKAERECSLWKMMMRTRCLQLDSVHHRQTVQEFHTLWNILFCADRKNSRWRIRLLSLWKVLWIHFWMRWLIRTRQYIRWQAAMTRIFRIWCMSIWMQYFIQIFIRMTRHSARKVGAISWIIQMESWQSAVLYTTRWKEHSLLRKAYLTAWFWTLCSRIIRIP